MKISVITVAYNAASSIEATIRSVLGQEYQDIEYIVIDGGSKDGTLEIINRYHAQIAYFVSEKDNGIYDAMNKGIKAATGDWIGFMNAGDVYTSKNVLDEVFGSGNVYNGIDVIFGDSREIDGDKITYYNARGQIETLATDFLYRHGASFVRRTTHLDHLFDLSLGSKLGYALDLWQIHSMYKAGCRFKYIPIAVVDFAKEGASAHPIKSLYYNFLIAHDLKFGVRERVAFIGVCAKSIARQVVRKFRRVIHA